VRVFGSFDTVAALLMFTSLIPSLAQDRDSRIAIDRGSLCVTEGEIKTDSGNTLSVDSSKMRAYVNRWTTDTIEAHFIYLGGTAEESRLGSGEVRRQFGLKLHAQNACNLVYAMWRFDPKSKLVVSVKKNPGQTTSSECGNRGYQNIKPKHIAPVPFLRSGDSHTLGAEQHGELLRVLVDGAPVWEGDLGPEVTNLAGPVGIRSDNVRLSFDLKTGVSGAMHPDFRLACKSGPGVSD
jgi:hypothetical protein